MFEAVALVVVLLALGKLASLAELFPESGADAINRFVIVIALPALVLKVVPGLVLSAELAKLALIPYASAALIGGLVWWISGALRYERSTRLTLVVLSAVGNTAFFGYPMVRALLGEDALPAAVVFDQLGSFVLLAVGVPLLLALGSPAPRPSPGQLLLQLLRFPPLLAVLLAFLLPPLNGVAAALIDKLAATLVPLSCFAVGLKFKLRLPTAELGALGLGLGAKLVLLPLAAFVIGHLLGLTPATLQVATFQAAMPAMISAAALLSAAQIKPELGAALVSYGLLCSLLILPLIAAML